MECLDDGLIVVAVVVIFFVYMQGYCLYYGADLSKKNYYCFVCMDNALFTSTSSSPHGRPEIIVKGGASPKKAPRK